MRARMVVLALFAAGAVVAACSSTSARDPGAPGQVHSQGSKGPGGTAPADYAHPVNALACDLYGELRADPGNLIFSPLSISAALGLTYAGAAGQTREEMQRVLHLPADDAKAYADYRSLFADLDRRAGAEGARWTLANRVWVQSGMGLLPAYLRTVRETFGAEVGEQDFRQTPEPARARINQWVEEKTEKRILDLFARGSITPATRLVLANAVYFKGLWQTQFDKEATRSTPFHVSGAETKPVPMMFLTQDFGYARLSWGRALELPYRGEQLSLVVLLPEAADGLPALESLLTADSLRAWTSALRTREVRVGLPRFTATSRFELNAALAALGMPSAFRAEAADFSGMTGRRDLAIDLVIHKAFVEVNEEGTEAAAATGVAIKATSIGPPPEEFLADRPFLYLIRDRASGCVLFLGRVSEPAS